MGIETASTRAAPRLLCTRKRLKRGHGFLPASLVIGSLSGFSLTPAQDRSRHAWHSSWELAMPLAPDPGSGTWVQRSLLLRSIVEKS